MAFDACLEGCNQEICVGGVGAPLCFSCGGERCTCPERCQDPCPSTGLTPRARLFLDLVTIVASIGSGIYFGGQMASGVAHDDRFDAIVNYGGLATSVATGLFTLVSLALCSDQDNFHDPLTGAPRKIIEGVIDITQILFTAALFYHMQQYASNEGVVNNNWGVAALSLTILGACTVLVRTWRFFCRSIDLDEAGFDASGAQASEALVINNSGASNNYGATSVTTSRGLEVLDEEKTIGSGVQDWVVSQRGASSGRERQAQNRVPSDRRLAQSAAKRSQPVVTNTVVITNPAAQRQGAPHRRPTGPSVQAGGRPAAAFLPVVLEDPTRIPRAPQASGAPAP